MEKILSHELREQAGSRSYNRFDYQVHWIVYHMINEYKKNSQFLILCEYHDDMAKITDFSSNCAEFFQIKTSENYSEWTLGRLTKTTKKKGGGIKHSFLGFIFYNFLQFESECSKCHFVSNIGMDSRLLEWQALIEDNKVLKDKNVELYNEIKEIIRGEYKEEISLETFEETFDRFIQNAFVYYGDLTLQNYEKVVAGEFFNLLENDDLYTSSSNKILRDIIEVVRKKSKTEIELPISLTRLEQEKGISSNIFSSIKQSIGKLSSKQLHDDLLAFFEQLGMSIQRKKLLIRESKQHQQNLLKVDISLYQDVTIQIIEKIDLVLHEHYDKIDEIAFILNEVKKRCNDLINEHSDLITPLRLEAVFYERLISEDSTI